MTAEEILEAKKLIAEFTGWAIEPGMEDFDDPFYNAPITKTNYIPAMFQASKMGFDSHWDWIIPACKKFDTLEDNFKDRIPYELHCDAIDAAVTCYEIEPVFKALVEAIKWYNTVK